MSLVIKFYFTSSMLNMFRTLIHPSSEACEFFSLYHHIGCVFLFPSCWNHISSMLTRKLRSCGPRKLRNMRSFCATPYNARVPSKSCSCTTVSASATKFQTWVLESTHPHWLFQSDKQFNKSSNSWRIRDQLDVTICCLISRLLCSTFFGH